LVLRPNRLLKNACIFDAEAEIFRGDAKIEEFKFVEGHSHSKNGLVSGTDSTVGDISSQLIDI